MGEIVITSDIIWAVIVLVLIYGLQESVFQRKADRYEKDFVQKRLQVLEEKYDQINAYYKENAKLYHDMNHHFNAVYFLLEHNDVQQAKGYLEEIMTPMHSTQISFRTGIDMLDVILQEMEKKANEREVKLDISVKSLINGCRFRKKDLCLLIVNVLENALEAAKSEVYVCIKQVHDMLFVEIKNDYHTKPYKIGGRFCTTKNEVSRHGWGIQIMENIVEKYEGSMEYFVDDKYVSVEIMLNEKEKPDV